jgi:hypothetical protein
VIFTLGLLNLLSQIEMQLLVKGTILAPLQEPFKQVALSFGFETEPA